MIKGGYRPGGKKIPGANVVLSQEKYNKIIAEGGKVPRGAQVRFRAAGDRPLSGLKVRFHTDGTMEIPVYGGREGKLRVARFLHADNIADGVRQAFHQIESVGSRIRQAEMIECQLASVHFDLVNRWQKFGKGERESFREYFTGIAGGLAKNPLLLREEKKISAIGRFGQASELLKEEKAGAAAAVIEAIRNDMGDWLRKLGNQQRFLERRRKLVVDKKFVRDTRIFGALDTLLANFNALASAGTETKARGRIAKELEGAQKRLYSLRLKPFSQAGIIVGRAAELVRKGEVKKAMEYIRDANKKIILAASPVSPVYPEKLREIARSKDSAFKEEVLANQGVLFHDMMPLWCREGGKAKRELILETMGELSALAQGLGKKEIAGLFSDAATALKNNGITMCTERLALAAAGLNPELAKRLV